MNDGDFDAIRRLRPDPGDLDDPGDPAVLSRTKEQLMSAIDQNQSQSQDQDQSFGPPTAHDTPDIYPRLAYRDELAAVEYLTRVFGFVEHHEARLEFDGNYLCWLRLGTGIVMVGHANTDVHLIHSPLDAGLTTAMLNVYVHDIDAHHATAVAQGAKVTVQLRDAFYGERTYEATDLEGHQWHFGERFEHIKDRGGRPPDPEDP